MSTTARPAGCSVVISHAASGKGFIYLGIQIITIGTNQESIIATDFAVHFGSKKHHGITFPGTLRMPENTKFSSDSMGIIQGFNDLINTQILVIFRQYFYLFTAGIVIDNEIFKDIHEIFPIANTFQ